MGFCAFGIALFMGLGARHGFGPLLLAIFPGALAGALCGYACCVGERSVLHHFDQFKRNDSISLTARRIAFALLCLGLIGVPALLIAGMLTLFGILAGR